MRGRRAAAVILVVLLALAVAVGGMTVFGDPPAPRTPRSSAR